jgi:hypothetical protein
MTPRPDDRTRAWLAGIVVLAALLRLLHLGYQSLWVDEMLTLTVATPKPGYPIWQLLRHNVHGPLHTFVVFLFRQLGEGDGWLRLPSAAAGVATVPLAFAWLRPRFGDRVALWCALLLAVNPLHIYYSQELRNYAFAVCFVLLGCVQIDRALARWSRGRAVAVAACVAAAALSNFSTVFAFAAQSLVFLRRGGWTRTAWARWAAVAALAALLISPWIYRVNTYVDFSRLVTPVLPGEIDVNERLRGETTVRMASIPYAAYAYSVGFTLGPSLRELHEDAGFASVVRRHAATVTWVGVVFGALLAAGCIGGARRFGWAPIVELCAFVAIPLAATIALNWQNAKAFNVRYVLVGLPAFLALVALGIEALGRVRITAAAVLITCALSLENYYFDPAYAKEDVRRALRAVEERSRPGECLFAPTVWQIVAHYQRKDAPLHYVYRDVDAVMERQMRGVFESCASLWYLRARPWVDDFDGRVLGGLESHYRAEETLEFPGVSAIHFVRKD